MSKAPVRARARLVAAGLWLVATLGPPSGEAQSWPAALPPDTTAILDVPYLPQSVLLCGGAALVMVERWWGRRGVYPEEFAALVRPAMGGIRTADLDSAARARGWDAQAIRGTPALVQRLLRERTPVIALIQVGRDRYHYVVVLAWDASGVVFHDPAGSPFTRQAEAVFLSRWAGAQEWALVIRPPQPEPPAAGLPLPTSPLEPTDSMPCRPWLDRALDAVAQGQLDAAALLLAGAARACPGEPMVLRELAAVRFKQGRHAEVIALITDYLALVPGDELAWQMLATSRYLTGDSPGALAAWNRIGRPLVDLVVITGSRRVRFPQLAAAVAIPPGTMLTSKGLALAHRRLQDIPALRHSSVGFRPVTGGAVEVVGAVMERPRMAPAWRLAATGILTALTQEAVALDLFSPTGAGEQWSMRWRWERARPLATLRVELPATVGVPGILTLEGAREGVRVAVAEPGPAIVEETWRTVQLGFGSWLTGRVRPSVGVGLEHWSGGRSYLTLGATTETRGWGDRLRLSATGSYAAALRDDPSWRRGGVRGMWASSLGLTRAAWSARLGGDWTSAGTPLGAWPVAGGTLSRAIPLRAEPSLRADVLAGRAAGRSMLHGGLSGDLPVRRVGPLALAVGVFLDGARVMRSADESVRDRNYLDGGLGIRIGAGDGELGILRIDLARGLLGDRRSAVTVGVHLGWPVYPQASR